MKTQPDEIGEPAVRALDTKRILQAMTAAVQEALLHHKREGLPVAIWRDGRVVWVPAEDIPIGVDREGRVS